MFGDFYPDAAPVLANPNGQVIIADGRNHVELTDRTYDIVVVDPPPPIESSGVSVISSLEFYQAAQARLNPGGVMMQWVPYGQTLDEFKAHVRTFEDVFPNVHRRRRARAATGSTCSARTSRSPSTTRRSGRSSARPGVLADINSAFDSPEARRRRLGRPRSRASSGCHGDQVAAFAGPGPLITDDRPLPEYFLLRHWLGTPSPRLSPSQVHAP